MDSTSLGEELQHYVVKRPGYREVIIEAIFANSLSQIITVIIIILLGPSKDYRVCCLSCSGRENQAKM